jgi:hypothetical protein
MTKLEDQAYERLLKVGAYTGLIVGSFIGSYLQYRDNVTKQNVKFLTEDDHFTKFGEMLAVTSFCGACGSLSGFIVAGLWPISAIPVVASIVGIGAEFLNIHIK